MTQLITRLLAAAILTATLAACSTLTGPVQPAGRWSGTVQVNGSYAGTIGADYDTRVWAWCNQYSECIVGRTVDWDLVDLYGERITATFHGNSITLRYTYGGATLTATMYRATTASAMTPDAGDTLNAAAAGSLATAILD